MPFSHLAGHQALARLRKADAAQRRALRAGHLAILAACEGPEGPAGPEGREGKGTDLLPSGWVKQQTVEKKTGDIVEKNGG